MKRGAGVLLFLLSACGGSSPAAPTPPAPLAQPSFAATGANVSVPSCEGVECAYTFQAINRGPGCGRAVQGVVTLVSSTGAAVTSDPWAIDPARIIHVNETFEVSNCCLNSDGIDASASASLTFTFEAVSCS